MNLYRYIQALKVDIIETERMLSLVSDHPIMSVGLREKLETLKLELSQLPKNIKEPRIQLLFSGSAVVGSTGIKSSFLGKTLKAFQEMVKTQSALLRYGNVAQRGRAKTGANADLYITALPTGSFGVELTQLNQNDLFEEEEVGEAIHNVMELIDKVCSSDESYETAISNTPKRNITNLKLFLEQINNEGSILKMQSGDLQIEVQLEEVRNAYTRLSSTTTIDQEMFINGLFRGVLLDSGKFEVQDTEGKKYHGFISDDLTEDTLIDYDQHLINRTCKFHIIEHNMTFGNGNKKVSYELVDIISLD